MNFLLSYKWMKEYLNTDLSAEAFAKKTTAAGNSIERMDKLHEKFDKMVVGFVKEVKKHPQADKLRIARVDIGKETVEIVCGGVNLMEGMRVVVGLPGARVRWHGQGDPVELSKTKIRGIESHGMICAADEIGFEKLATGEQNIWDMTNVTDAKPGTPILEALDLDDVIFDIEVTSNRPDCQSIIGQAREGAAVLGMDFLPPGQRTVASVPSGKKSMPLTIEVKESALCPKYCAILLDHVNVGPSPWWLQKRLLLAGHRPINNIVDITNYVLHEYGQPLHAFDADQLDGQKIVVRRAKNKEKFLALDGKEYELSSERLVIADAHKVVALAGVMGGEKSATTPGTTRVLIESATFDPVSVRRTARALNVFSDSQRLFEKGLSTQATTPALERAVELILQVVGGSIASDLMEIEAKPYEPVVLSFDPVAANRLMGMELAPHEMVEILQRLGFQTEEKNDLRVTVPYWRDHDIETRVDFVEEIARIYGYENFPSILPTGLLPTGRSVPALEWTRRAKRLLCGMGLSEMYSQSFVSQKQLECYALSPKQSVKLRNPLSFDLEFMRPSLVPSMLTSIEQNQSRFPSGHLFEIAPVYLLKKQDLPEQPLRLVLAVYGKDGRESFLRAKGFLDRFVRVTGVGGMLLKRGTNEALWHAGSSASIQKEKQTIGVIGQISDTVSRAFGLDGQTVLVEFDFEALVSFFRASKSYTPLSPFPFVKRDLAFVLDERVEYETVVAVLEKMSALLQSVELFDIYRGKGVEEGKKSLALHFFFRSDERTLEAKEVDLELEKMRNVLENKFHAMMRS